MDIHGQFEIISPKDGVSIWKRKRLISMQGMGMENIDTDRSKDPITERQKKMKHSVKDMYDSFQR